MSQCLKAQICDPNVNKEAALIGGHRKEIRDSEASVIDWQIDRQGFQYMDTRLRPNERC